MVVNYSHLHMISNKHKLNNTKLRTQQKMKEIILLICRNDTMSNLMSLQVKEDLYIAIRSKAFLEF
jgi:hypothetical protein